MFRIVRCLHYAKAERLTHLLRGETYPFRSMHGIDHVFGQFGEFLVKDGYVPSGLPEDGFVVLCDAKDHF
jgi:hypothetical protein